MPAAAYVQSAAFLVLAAVALFVSAGTIHVPIFWLYLAILAGVILASLILLDPDLARERMRPAGRRQPLALWLFTVVMILHWVIAGLDRGRFHWSDTVPLALRIGALISVAAGYALALWAMRVNRFFSSVVRIQSDRGQHVVTTGPYAFIRHPGYLAGMLVVAASGISLCSWLATAMLVVCIVPYLLYRTAAEDRLLQAELPGYRDYTAQVRWRILPGIW